MKPWVKERMDAFLPQVSALTLADEERIAEVCAQEIQSWRDRPGIRSASSLKEPLKDARNALRQQLALTDANSYTNRKGEREHIALRYLTFSAEEWGVMNRPSEEKFHERLTHQLMIRQPDEVVARVEALLLSSQWEEVAAGLCCATGRRIFEVLKAGEVRPKSLYSVLFRGQLKSDLVEEYEIPTLVPGSVVVTAWLKLRELRD